MAKEENYYGKKYTLDNRSQAQFERREREKKGSSSMMFSKVVSKIPKGMSKDTMDKIKKGDLSGFMKNHYSKK